MICKNCGAEIEQHIAKCPYCGAQNDAVAQKEHDENIMEYQKKAYFWRALPEKIARKGQRGVVLLLLLVAIVAVLVTVIGSVVQKKKEQASYEKENQLIQELEAAYQKGDYQKVEKLFQGEHRGFGAKFEKYRRVSDLQFFCEMAEDLLEDSIEMAKKEGSSTFLESCNYWLTALEACDTYEQQGFVYQEGEAVSYYRTKIYQQVQTYFQMDEEQLQEHLEAYKQLEDSEKPDYKVVFAQALYEKMK